MLLPVAADGVRLEPVLDGVKVVPEHPGTCGILSYLILSHMEVIDPIQDTWQVQAMVGGPVWDSRLLAQEQEAARVLRESHRVTSRTSCSSWMFMLRHGWWGAIAVCR